MLNNITPIILTYNEAENIHRTLSAVSWAKQVLVIDSGSDDDTESICGTFKNVRFLVNPFEDAAKQCNFALQQDIQTEWVLSMDADYVVTNELTDELSSLEPAKDINGYEIHFQYLIDGIPLRGSLYPSRICLYRHALAKYIQDGHTQRVQVEGKTSVLKAKLQHDDRKPYSRWLNSQLRYAQQEAQKMQASPWPQLKLVDKLRRMGIAPLLILPYTLLYKGLLLDGKAGWKYASQRLTAETKIWSALFRSTEKNP